MRVLSRHRAAVVLLGLVALAVGARDVTAADCPLRPVTDRVHVIVGGDRETCAEAALEHPVTNPAAIIGDTGVILVDPGASVQIGRLLLRALAQVTDKPVVAVFNSHIHGLYWLGNQAIREAFPDAPIYAHERMIERIDAGEGAYWAEVITGDAEGGKTAPVAPDRPLQGGETLDIAGVALRVHHPGHAHTDHDLAIELPAEGVVFLGGLVVEPEVPSQGVPADARFRGQLAAIRDAIALDAEHYVPGRGQPGGVELPERAARFLDNLYRGVEQGYDDGLSDFEITDRLKAELKSFQEWYDFTHLGAVVSAIYLQVEQEQF
jgi:glyoxylase-like metal-dependent hydrolase (beta-lactamase superfamily II)